MPSFIRYLRQLYMSTLRSVGITSAAALLLSASVAFAQEEPTTLAQREDNSVRSPQDFIRPATTSPVRGDIEQAQRERERTQAMREEVRDRMEKQREEARTRLEEQRTQAQARVQEQREKAAKRLSDIQDRAKQQMAQRLAGQFENLNAKWTDHFMRQLERYDTITQKIHDRSNIAADALKDVTATNAAILAAEAAITRARTAVIAQAAKTYTLDTSTVTTTTATTTANAQGEIMRDLRALFQNLHRTLFEDLFALRDGPMTDVRRAVQSAHQTLSSISRVDDEREAATSTP